MTIYAIDSIHIYNSNKLCVWSGKEIKYQLGIEFIYLSLLPTRSYTHITFSSLSCTYTHTQRREAFICGAVVYVCPFLFNCQKQFTNFCNETLSVPRINLSIGRRVRSPPRLLVLFSPSVRGKVVKSSTLFRRACVRCPKKTPVYTAAYRLYPLPPVGFNVVGDPFPFVYFERYPTS